MFIQQWLSRGGAALLAAGVWIASPAWTAAQTGGTRSATPQGNTAPGTGSNTSGNSQAVPGLNGPTPTQGSTPTQGGAAPTQQIAPPGGPFAPGNTNPGTSSATNAGTGMNPGFGPYNGTGMNPGFGPYNGTGMNPGFGPYTGAGSNNGNGRSLGLNGGSLPLGLGGLGGIGGMGGLSFLGLGSFGITINGYSIGQGIGQGLANTLMSDVFNYLAYREHGYGTGQPQLYPNANMMAIIQGSPVAPMGQPGTAMVQINAPKDAEVSVNGNRLKWTNQGWLYRSGSIGANDIQHLAVRAKWGSDHYEVTRTADVVLRPGERKSVTFIGGAGSPP